MKQKEDEELSLFLEMQKLEREKTIFPSRKWEEIDASIEAKPCKSPIPKVAPSAPTHNKIRADDFLNSENDKTDYNWLLTPPKTPPFPSLEMEPRKTLMSQVADTNAHPITLNARLANPIVEGASRGNVSSQQQTSSSSLNSSGKGNRRSSSSGRPASTASRLATPTNRLTLSSSTRTLRPSTPTSRATHPSTKPTTAVRSSTPTRPLARPSTPTSRTSIPVSKSASRSAIPTHQSSVRSSVSSIAAPRGRSSSVAKSGTKVSKSPVSLHGGSPTVKSRPWKPSEMPGFSFEAPPNLRTSFPVRPSSASRGRPASGSTRSSSAENVSDGIPLRQSSCPSRGRAQSVNSYGNRTSIHAINQAHSNGYDNVSPVVIGTKMVERLVNTRKLAPPKQDENCSLLKNFLQKSLTSQDSSGFGRTLSKISLDMALRHMDITRSAPGKLHPVMTKIPASSMYSVRSVQTSSGRTNSVLGSPLASSSNASSELSVNNDNSHCLGDSDIGSERCQLSPAAIHGR